MNSKMKVLLGSGLLVLVLGVVMILLLQAPPVEEETVSTVSTEPTYAMIEENINDFTSLSVNNPSSSFTILPETVVVPATEEGGEDTETVAYVIDELRIYDQTQEDVARLVNELTALYASDRVFETVEDKAAYGLDQPQATLTLNYEGDEVILYLGAENEGTKVYYAMVEGDDALYTISSSIAGDILLNALDYIDPSMLPVYDLAAEVRVIMTDLTITRPDTAPITLQLYSGTDDSEVRAYMSSYEMTSPIQSELNYYVDEEFLPALFGTTAQGVVALYDPAQAATYGFDAPTMTMDLGYLDLEGNHIMTNIVVGAIAPAENEEDTETYYYVLKDDNGLVYRVAATALPALTADADDMVTTLPLLPNITTISTVDLLLDGQTHTLTFESELPESEDGEEVTPEVVGASVDGVEVDVDESKQFYQLILSVAVEGISTEAVSGDPAIQITYHYTDGGSDTLAGYLLADGRTNQLVVNGEALYAGRAGFNEKVKTELENLLAGEEVDVDW